MVKAIIFGGGRLLTLAITASGIAFDISGESIFGMSSDDLRLTIYMAIGVFFLLTLYREIELAFQKRPKISVSHKEFRDTFFLDVTNKGEAANFESQITLLSVCIGDDWESTQEFLPWKSAWESNRNQEVEIKQNHCDSLALVQIGHEASKELTLRLMAYDIRTDSRIILKEFTSRVVAIKINVKISSNPSPKNGIFNKNYQVTVFDMVEVKRKISKSLIRSCKLFILKILRRNKFKERIAK